MGIPALSRELALEAVRASREHSTSVAAAESLGIPCTTFKSRLTRAKEMARQGLLGTDAVLPGFEISRISEGPRGTTVEQRPERGETFVLPDTHSLGKITFTVGPDGKVERQHVRAMPTVLDHDALIDRIQAKYESLNFIIPSIPAPEKTDGECLNFWVFGFSCGKWSITCYPPVRIIVWKGAFEMIAALYVETNGCYFGLDGIDPWDELRDARRYDGPHPVVAHPPCQRWGKLWAGQPLFIKQTGIRKVKGDDGGCFKAALDAVRKFGGVLEHPWQSHAWPHFGLNMPPRKGGWIAADFHGGWTCCVEQGRYGHYARKPTLLYAIGVELPELEWGHSEMKLDPAVVERMGLKRAKRLGEVGARGGGQNSTPRIHTPPPFRDLLISMAYSADRKRCAA